MSAFSQFLVLATLFLSLGAPQALAVGESGEESAVPVIVSADQVDAIRELAEGYGDARVVALDNGDPAIVGDINGTAYQLFFLECEDGKNCGALNFYAIWDVPTVSVGALNVWNRSSPFNKAYLTEENRPVIEMNLPAEGGFVREQLDYIFSQWTIALAEFSREVIAEAP
ncbi:YbjN domain-containing protein [Fulvimarina sp. MAC8]|uniref:YbjN domain-containing protein n=1 Tax=Fulvimarina sp. MAC8 TaxID=3162874 RepID=UPI0032EBFAF3